jgi:hypothetical protein
MPGGSVAPVVFRVDCPPPAAPGGAFRVICDGHEATRVEWESGVDPDRLLSIVRGQASDRKLRLFACACCRRFVDQLDHEHDRLAVRVGERIADAGVDGQEHEEARLLHCDLDLAAPDAHHAASQAVSAAVAFAANRPGRGKGNSGWGRAAAEERRALCDLLRDILGNPFRPKSAEPSWLALNQGAVLQMAQAIYKERTFDCMPILADALEEAGCSDGEILGHCRHAHGHVFGCWVVDLLLAKG